MQKEKELFAGKNHCTERKAHEHRQDKKAKAREKRKSAAHNVSFGYEKIRR